jgi:hypothetical protein
MAATIMEIEREASWPTTTCTELESAAARSLLEEMGKWMSSRATRGRTTITLHGVIRVIAVVEALPQLWVRQHLVRFVHNGHLSFAATLIRVCFKGSPATTKNERRISKEANETT